MFRTFRFAKALIVRQRRSLIDGAQVGEKKQRANLIGSGVDCEKIDSYLSHASIGMQADKRANQHKGLIL